MVYGYTFSPKVIAITVCLLVFYTDDHGLDDDGCETNKWLISFNFVMMFIMAFISVRSQAEERGLFQAAVVSFYTTYGNLDIGFGPVSRISQLHATTLTRR